MIRRDLPAVSAVFPLEERLGLLAHDDPDVVALVADLIRDDPGLNELPVERWLALIEGSGPNALELLCELIERRVAPQRVSMEQALRLALSRPLPLARLGFRWLQAMPPRDDAGRRALLGLVEAESEPLRPELVRWAPGCSRRPTPSRRSGCWGGSTAVTRTSARKGGRGSRPSRGRTTTWRSGNA